MGRTLVKGREIDAAQSGTQILFKGMVYSYFIGWDIAKGKVNYCLIDQQHNIIAEGEVVNEVVSITSKIEALLAHHFLSSTEVLHCIENTGLYSNRILQATCSNEYHVWLEDPFQIHRSSGRQTDKTDRLDARQIARYAQRFAATQCELYTLPTQALLVLDEVQGVRSLLVEAKARLKTSFVERRKFRLHNRSMSSFESIICNQIKSLKASIAELEKYVAQVILEDIELRQLYEIVRSVPGMGPVTSISMILETQAFTKIKTAKQCASYAGLAPRRQQSGKLLNRIGRGRAKGSIRLKTTLHQAAHCLITRPGVWQSFYRKKRSEGKSYLTAINALRNKVCRVLFACVKSNTMYNKNIHLNLE